jgi:hypothetical protein
MNSYVSEYGVMGGDMIVVAHNICLWYDGTMRPARGHIGKCRWHFDGQVWWHGRIK